MAFLTLLLSFIGKKIGSIVQAIFGWSVTALFGRLPRRKQLAVSIALLVSIAWPIFVSGVFFPAVAGWVLAFLPIERWMGPLAMRIVWGALALLAPLLVGGLAHWAAPSTKGGVVRSLVNGYPLALGFFVAFLLTVVTVPLVKLASILRGWTDEHVYLQPRVGAYDKVLREVAEACARAGLVPEIADMPTSMALSTKVLKLLAGGMVSPIVAEQIRCVRAEGLEMYLYPSDLLLRGEAEKVALVRAMLTRTEIDADAYLVGSDGGQCIQDELHRLIGVIASHEKDHFDVGATVTSRLVEIWNEMNEAKLPFDEWVMLESIARRIERRLVRGKLGAEALPLDYEDDELDKMSKTSNERQETVMTIEPPQSEPSPAMLDEGSTADLVREAMYEAKELVRLEVELAKEELKEELQPVKRASILFGVAFAATALALCMLAVALVLALGGTAIVALAIAGGAMGVSGVGTLIGYRMLPKSMFEKTRNRLQNDANQLKEHLA